VTQQDGHVSAWKAFNDLLASDLAKGEGFIRPARILYATADREKLALRSVEGVVAEMMRIWSNR
jgi:hypothetical protein